MVSREETDPESPAITWTGSAGKEVGTLGMSGADKEMTEALQDRGDQCGLWSESLDQTVAWPGTAFVPWTPLLSIGLSFHTCKMGLSSWGEA